MQGCAGYTIASFRSNTKSVLLHRRVAVKTHAVVDKTVSTLLSEIAGTKRGLNTPAELQSSILSHVAQLGAAYADCTTTDPQTLSATWKLLWTTEKETLFIVQNASWFGTEAGEVYQVIDVNASRLQNVITFPPSGAFIVDSSIAVEGPQRVSFKFSAAKLKTAGRDFAVPPFGQGWFDTIYCDDDIRIAQDIRGDTLIVSRDGPPRIFS
eukprot:gene10821-10978_t